MAPVYARRTEAVAVVALEVVPVAKEYGLDPGPAPVLIRADGYGPLDDAVAAELEDAASAAGHPVRHVAVSRYGSDASRRSPRAGSRAPHASALRRRTPTDSRSRNSMRSTPA